MDVSEGPGAEHALGIQRLLEHRADQHLGSGLRALIRLISSSPLLSLSDKSTISKSGFWLSSRRMASVALAASPQTDKVRFAVDQQLQPAAHERMIVDDQNSGAMSFGCGHVSWFRISLTRTRVSGY